MQRIRLHAMHRCNTCVTFGNVDQHESKQLAIIDIALASKERETPEYIQMDEKNKKVKFVRTPKFEEVPYPIVMEPNLVIEYYSR